MPPLDGRRLRRPGQSGTINDSPNGLFAGSAANRLLTEMRFQMPTTRFTGVNPYSLTAGRRLAPISSAASIHPFLAAASTSATRVRVLMIEAPLEKFVLKGGFPPGRGEVNTGVSCELWVFSRTIAVAAAIQSAGRGIAPAPGSPGTRRMETGPKRGVRSQFPSNRARSNTCLRVAAVVRFRRGSDSVRWSLG